MDLLFPVFNRTWHENVTDWMDPIRDCSGLEFQTQLQGGFSTASIQLREPHALAVQRYSEYLGAFMIIYDLWFRRVYEGRVQDISLSEEGSTMKIEGLYGHASEILDGEIYPFQEGYPVPAKTVITQAINLTEGTEGDRIWKDYPAFRLQDADVDVTGTGTAKDYSTAKINEAIEDTCKLGYRESDGRPIYFAIYGNRIPYFFKEPNPNSSSLALPWRLWRLDECNIADFVPSRSRANIYNKIWGQYESANGSVLTTSAAEDKISQARYGTREAILNVGQTYQANITALRDYALQTFAYPRQSFQISVAGMIRTFGGIYDYPWIIRAGDMVTMPGLDPHLHQLDDPFSMAVSAITGMVMSTSYSYDDNINRLEINSKDTRFDTMLARLGIQGSLS